MINISDRCAQVLNEALSLSPSERAQLAKQLLSSLDLPHRQRLDELWGEEAEDRLDAFDRGEMEPIPAEQVFP